MFCPGGTTSLPSGYYPRTNGQMNRANQEMEAALHCITSFNPSSWSTLLPWVEYMHNTFPNASFGMSLFFAPLAINLPYFLHRNRNWLFPRFKPTCATVPVFGEKPGLLCSAPPPEFRNGHTAAAPWLPATPLVK